MRRIPRKICIKKYAGKITFWQNLEKQIRKFEDKQIIYIAKHLQKMTVKFQYLKCSTNTPKSIPFAF